MAIEKILSAKGLAVVAAGAGIWMYFSQKPPAHGAEVLDPSGSVARNCSGMRDQTGLLLAKPGIRDGSTIALLIMGRDAASPQPTRVLDARVPVPPDAMLNRKQRQAEYEKARTKLLDDFEEACNEAADSPQSPVFQMVKEGLAHLHARGCGPEQMCYLVAKTDARESVQPELRALIERRSKKLDVKVPPDLAGSLDNTSVAVTFCGAVEVSAHRQPNARDPDPDHVERIWKQLFRDPSIVTFVPYCGK
ncbi:MAG TPA: hypothetical protein VGN17_01920 [Bryobacteraceae bacterium]|jgi:hypothetical protein